MFDTLFLDRDGVINVDKGYIYKADDFEWINGAIDTIKYIKSKGYYIFVVTNQSGIARGYYSENDVDKLHIYINEELRKFSSHIDDFFYSPYHPSVKDDKYDKFKNHRKPNTGMLEEACNKWSIDKSTSLLIGNSQTDIQCANNFGIPGYLFNGNDLFYFIQTKIKL